MSEEAGGEIRVLERFSLVDLATDHAERALDRLDGTLAIAACGGLVLTGTAIAGGEAPTTVTIKTPGGDVYGTVKSPKLQKCANGRKVSVHRTRLPASPSRTSR